MPVGGFIGSVSGAAFSKLGRRMAMILIDIISIIGCLMYLWAVYYKSLSCLEIARLVCGICSGLNTTIVPLYIQEISPLSISGATGSYNELFITIGIWVTSLIGLGLGEPNDG